jgi:hypothetical protein
MAEAGFSVVHDESRVRPETTTVKMVGTFLVSLSCDLPVSVTFRSMLWQLLRKVAFLTLVCDYLLNRRLDFCCCSLKGKLHL